MSNLSHILPEFESQRYYFLMLRIKSSVSSGWSAHLPKLIHIHSYSLPHQMETSVVWNRNESSRREQSAAENECQWEKCCPNEKNSVNDRREQSSQWGGLRTFRFGEKFQRCEKCSFEIFLHFCIPASGMDFENFSLLVMKLSSR